MIFAVDVGTTVLKAALFDEDGKALVQKERRIGVIPHADPLRHEVDAREWIDALLQVSRECGIEDNRGLRAVAVSGNGPTLLPVGEDDEPADNAMTWMDRRAIEESKTVSELAGITIDPAFYLPKVYWIYKNRPELYRRTKFFFSCSEYINYLLSGFPHTILPAPEYRPYIWTEELVTELGMDWKKFPDFIRPGETVGKVSGKAGGRFGIPAGTPVFAGGPDFVVSLLGTATVSPGRVCDRSGTSEGINLCTDTLVKDPRLLCMSHVIRELYNISGVISTSGKAFDWFRKIVGKSETSYDEIFTEIGAAEPGAGGLLFIPYLTGERSPIWDPHARGMFIGLTLKHDRKDMLRAVAESVGFAVRDIITVMEELGLKVEDLRITGSQAKSPIWTQIKADITGKIIHVPVIKDAELMGNFIVGLTGLGGYKNLAEASEALVKVEETYYPREENRKMYDHLFDLYRKSYTNTKGICKELSIDYGLGR